MTIGIGASGPNAGLAIFRGLRAAEAVGRGAIGGFVTYAAITADGQLHRQQTQRGGTKTLFIAGEQTGVDPPDAIATAPCAALISSGPERPEPLTQFLAAAPDAGLVTGHRLPNGPSRDGTPLNEAALTALRQGHAAQGAVDGVLEANPQADVGLIAVDRQGGVYGRNSERVAQRPDLGAASLADPAQGIAVAVLHNAIQPFPELAALVARVVFDTLLGESAADGWITLVAGIPVELGAENAVYCDGDGISQRFVTTDPVLVSGSQAGAALYLHSRVYRDGKFLGYTQFEPIVTVVDGQVRALSGQTQLAMSYRRKC